MSNIAWSLYFSLLGCLQPMAHAWYGFMEPKCLTMRHLLEVHQHFEKQASKKLRKLGFHMWHIWKLWEIGLFSLNVILALYLAMYTSRKYYIMFFSLLVYKNLYCHYYLFLILFEAGLWPKLASSLLVPQPPRSWDYRHVPLYLFPNF
jgi:hypothetical protein